MISIIIIVKNDIEKTKKPEKTEIIVVDASKKETLLDIKKKFPKVRWFYYVNKTGKKITIPEQRNLGIKKSKGDIITFVDAGCTVERDWLAELIKPIKEENESFVTGLVKSKNKPSFHEVHWIERKNKAYLFECGTANTSFKKEIINKLGFFDENFNYGSDTEFSWRVVRGGYKIRYNPSAVIYINWGNLKQEIKRAFRYGEARANLYKKYRLKLNFLFKKNELFTIYSVLFFIYILSLIPISLIFPYYLLFLLVPFIKNIKNQPLRKMIFDFFWGYGVIKRLIEIIFVDKKRAK
jgi:GT2 family glycosyltransferase